MIKNGLEQFHIAKLKRIIFRFTYDDFFEEYKYVNELYQNARSQCELECALKNRVDMYLHVLKQKARNEEVLNRQNSFLCLNTAMPSKNYHLVIRLNTAINEVMIDPIDQINDWMDLIRDASTAFIKENNIENFQPLLDALKNKIDKYIWLYCD